jgi:serine/threonine protein kinase
MKLDAGTRLGPYEIHSALGAGGMGEVYRARDTRLGRDVAVKILASSFVDDADHVARFQREAQVLAALNHPHIAHIYGLEDAGGGLALVMELVEGETLADRIAQGPIPLDEALPIARQVADALEAAHEQGIVHRDLKPSNISIRSDGTVKVLDFGLAKLTEAGEAGRAGGAVSMSPTITSPALVTGAGMILGTAAYMSPEQARGKAADKRADVWAFGCVLYEMLTGRRAFGAEEVSDTLAMVLMKEPDWSLLPPATPPSIRTLLRRCLEKDRKRRLPDLGAARLEIDETLSAPPSQTSQESIAPKSSRPRGQHLAWGVAALAIAVAMGIGIVRFAEPRPEPARSIRFQVSAPPDVVLASDINLSPALSPDGRTLAFLVVSRAGDRPRLAVRALDAEDAREVPGTEGAANAFWSPDSRFIGFFASGKLKKIDPAGGVPQVICDVPTGPGGSSGGTWNEDGIIVFGGNDGPLFRVPAGGGMPTPLTKLDAAKKELRHTYPWFLPDGRHFFYFSASPSTRENSIYIGSLDDDEKVALLQADSKAVYADGHMLFVRQGTLVAQPFDATRRVTTGDAVVEAQDVFSIPAGGTAPFAVSTNGVLAFRSGTTATLTQLTLVDRSGRQLETVAERSDQTALELSPDGARVVVSVFDPSKRARDIWIHDLKRDVRTRFTFNAGDDLYSAWSPDGARLVFSSGGPTPLDVYQQAANGSGSEERLLGGGGNKYVTSWSPDGRFVMYHIGNAGSPTGNDIWIMPTFGDRKPQPFVQTPFNDTMGRFSPDGRWVAYQSGESGRNEVYVVPFPGPGGKWQVSTGGGQYPRWRRDGKELFFLAGANTVMSATVNGAGSAFEVGAVQRLFEAPLRTNGYLGFGSGYVYDVFPDGQRFLIDKLADEQAAPAPIQVITNWTSTLR